MVKSPDQQIAEAAALMSAGNDFSPDMISPNDPSPTPERLQASLVNIDHKIDAMAAAFQNMVSILRGGPNLARQVIPQLDGGSGQFGGPENGR